MQAVDNHVLRYSDTKVVQDDDIGAFHASRNIPQKLDVSLLLVGSTSH